MANKTLTAVDEFSDARTPVNLDAPDMALDEDCHQRAANRTYFLNQRRKAPISSSADDSIAALEAAWIGDTDWHDSTVVTKTVTGNVGDVIPIICICGALFNSDPTHVGKFRLKCVDNGVTEYLDGAAVAFAADGLSHQLTFFAKHTMASTTAVLTLQAQNSNNAISTQLVGGWVIGTL